MMTMSKTMCENKYVFISISEGKGEVPGEVFWIVDVLEVVCSGLS